MSLIQANCEDWLVVKTVLNNPSCLPTDVRSKACLSQTQFLLFSWYSLVLFMYFCKLYCFCRPCPFSHVCGCVATGKKCFPLWHACPFFFVSVPVVLLLWVEYLAQLCLCSPCGEWEFSVFKGSVWVYKAKVFLEIYLKSLS